MCVILPQMSNLTKLISDRSFKQKITDLEEGEQNWFLCIFDAFLVQKTSKNAKKTKNSTKKTQLKKINEYLCCIPWDVRISCITFSGVTETTYGEVPEWLNGSDCKSDGSAFDGSNPSLSTISAMRASYSGYYPSLPSLRDGFDSRCPLQCNLMISLDFKSIKILNFSRE